MNAFLPQAPLPLFLFKTAHGLPDQPGLDDRHAPDGDEGGRFVRCGACGRPVAAPESRGEVGGRHAHVFANPGGHVFEIGCFQDAFGCRGEGPFVAEFSWFDGFAWQVALCRYCDAHLGWRYRTLDGAGPGFWGLILGRVSEE